MRPTQSLVLYGQVQYLRHCDSILDNKDLRISIRQVGGYREKELVQPHEASRQTSIGDAAAGFGRGDLKGDLKHGRDESGDGEDGLGRVRAFERKSPPACVDEGIGRDSCGLGDVPGERGRGGGSHACDEEFDGGTDCRRIGWAVERAVLILHIAVGAIGVRLDIQLVCGQ